MNNNPTFLRELRPVVRSDPRKVLPSAPVVTNLHVHIDRLTNPFSNRDRDCDPDLQNWYRVEKDLCLGRGDGEAYLFLEIRNQDELTAEDWVVTDIEAGLMRPYHGSWTERNGGICVQREKFTLGINKIVTAVDVLFGEDAVDPRPQWILLRSPLRVRAHVDSPSTRLTFLRGRVGSTSASATKLRVSEDGEFKIVQISDLHLTTGVGICDDAMEKDGIRLRTIRADQETLGFVETILEDERPDLVAVTGDQLHHDIDDSQTAIFKAAAPMVARSIPWAFIFGNHDDEGRHALSRATQMSIYMTLPFCCSTSGPEDVDGVGNFYLHILAPLPSQLPVATLYFFDSHGESKRKPPLYRKEYDCIDRTQTEWFRKSSRANRDARKQHSTEQYHHHSLAFMHIPPPIFSDDGKLRILSGRRREPTEGSGDDSGLYDALSDEGVEVLTCGHDHTNDFVAWLRQAESRGSGRPPFLIYPGTVGYGGYCSYSGVAYHRRARIFQFTTDRLMTWLQVQYQEKAVDKTVLVDEGEFVGLPEEQVESRIRNMS